MRALGASRTSLVPGGVLAGPWVRDGLWRNARAVPSLDLRFADNKSLVDAVTGASPVTFTRASSGTYVDSAGVIQTAATNEPRFDHNPTTGESLGLLVEEQRTNLLLRSEEFGDVAWALVRATISANAETAPNGTLTADKLVEDTTAANTHQITQTAAGLASGVPYTASIFIKAAGRTSALVLFAGTPFGVAGGQFFNLSSGTLGNVVGTLDRTATIEAYPNDWYRVSITKTTTALGAGGITVRTAVANSSNTDGDGTSGIFLWEAQLEAASTPSSYIPTTTAAVTRSADVASITGSAFSSWYRQDEGTMFADARTQQSASSHVLGGVSTGSFASSAYLSKETDNALKAAPDASPSNLNIVLQSVTSNVALRSALAFTAGTGSASAVMNGGAVGTDASTGIPITMSQMGIGCAPWNIGTNAWNNTIRRLTYWPTRLSNASLQSITQ